MARPVFASIDAYIAAQPPDVQPVLDRVRAIIRKLLPKAEETISYGVPTYKMHGTYVVYFAGFKEHYSLFPVTAPIVAAYKGDLSAHKASKGTLRFAYTEPVPAKLIQGVVKVLEAAAAARVASQQARRAAKTKTKTKTKLAGKVVLSLLLLVLGARHSAAECIEVFEPDPVKRMRDVKYVYLGKVTEVGPSRSAKVKVVRSWKGGGSTFTWDGSHGAAVGEYYLVFGDSDPEVFPYECGNRPIPARSAQKEMGRLNKHRGFPRLLVTLPDPSPKP